MHGEIAFSTFLKILQLPAGPRKTALKRLLEGHGYPYWRPLQLHAIQAIQPAASLSALEAKIDLMCSGTQAKYNKQALKALFAWAQSKSCIAIEPLPAIVVPFGDSGLKIRLRPELSFQLGQDSFSMALWATTKPLLNNLTLSVGLQFMKTSYHLKGFTQRKFLILDSVTNRVFSEQNILPSTPAHAKMLWKDLKKVWSALVPSTSPGPHGGRPTPPSP